jgi:hypothetical protein
LNPAVFGAFAFVKLLNGSGKERMRHVHFGGTAEPLVYALIVVVHNDKSKEKILFFTNPNI